MKSFQIRSLFWSIFSCNRSRKNFYFGHFSRSDSRFSFSCRNCFRTTLLKICKFCTWPYFPILLGTHRSCSPILVFDLIVLWIAVSLSHMFYLAFAASDNLMTRANVNRWIYRRSHPEVFVGKGVLKIYSKFTGEHPCRSAISIKMLCNFIEITIRHEWSPVNLLHIFRTHPLKNTFGWLLMNINVTHLI